MKKHWRYLKYVLVHKWYVLKACFRLGIPWRGLVHDLSKFSPSEWTPYVNFFFLDKTDKAAFDVAWLFHQHRNRHHWQYWILSDRCLVMPDVYVREMVADWYGAGIAMGKPDLNAWYAANKGDIKLHPDTRVTVEILLSTL